MKGERELFKKRGLTMLVDSYYGDAPTNRERRKCRVVALMKTKYGNIPISFRPTIKVMGLIRSRVKKTGKTMTKVIEDCIEKVLGNG